MEWVPCGGAWAFESHIVHALSSLPPHFDWRLERRERQSEDAMNLSTTLERGGRTCACWEGSGYVAGVLIRLKIAVSVLCPTRIPMTTLHPPHFGTPRGGDDRPAPQRTDCAVCRWLAVQDFERPNTQRLP